MLLKRCSFILLQFRRWTKSKGTILHITTVIMLEAEYSNFSTLTQHSITPTQNRSCRVERYKLKSFVTGRVLKQISISLCFIQNSWYLLIEGRNLLNAGNSTDLIQLHVQQRPLIICNYKCDRENARNVTTVLSRWKAIPIFLCAYEMEYN
jgi:hypothetical protein